MKAKYKMTGCARFMIFLVILAPIAYFGSKYLRDSGTWDKIKDKVENRDSNSVERTIDNRNTPPDPISNDDVTSDERYKRLRDAYDQQEVIISQQKGKIQSLEDELETLRKSPSVPPTTQANIPSREETTSERPANKPSTSGTPSLDDLLNEADGNLGTTPTGSTENSSDTRRTNLGAWNFSYSTTSSIMSGQIEFYQQNSKFLSRITIDGDNRVTIDELQRSGDRFSVIGSRTGEYYVLKRNGDLDAYDQNGFQTTCQKAN